MIRETGYAKCIKEANLDFGDGNLMKAEKLFIKNCQQEELRFSWWVNGQFRVRPVDLPGKEWIKLFAKAKEEGVFSDWFLDELKKLVE